MYGLLKNFIATIFQQEKKSRHRRRGGPAVPRARPYLEHLETRLVPSAYVQTNLISDVPNLAQFTDSSLKNPWGVSFSPTSPFWISDQGTNTSTVYTVKNGQVTKNLSVNIPTAANPPNGPTGQVNNTDTSAFKLNNGQFAHFIFADLNGTISAWNTGPTAEVKATVAGAVFTGLAIDKNAAGDFLYAANGAQGKINIFDSTFAPVTPGTDGFATNAFVDPSLPANLVPFNIQRIGNNLYVTYAPSGRAAQTGAKEGQGAVAIFDSSGKFIRQLIEGSKLASPWGITLAPGTFGQFGGALLVGNFAYNFSEINAFDPKTGAFLGTLTDPGGHKILNQALWDIAFGNGGNGGDQNTLYFAAGINGEKDGLFGSIQAVPTVERDDAIVPNLSRAPEQTFSTIPDNGDLNPYGVAFVPADFQGGGKLHPGDLLVSNFNNAQNAQMTGNLQGTGTTIIQIGPTGQRSTFFQGTQSDQQRLGLTTALGLLKSGFVIVGNVPTTDGTFGTIQQGSLLILDSNGKVVETLADRKLLDGPWDLTINDQGNWAQVFVSNVLSGTVTRIDLKIPRHGKPVVESMTQIASGYKHEENDTALVVGPTGLAYDARRDILYVASTDDNAIYAIPDAGRTHRDHGTGKVIYQDNLHLHGPLGLVLAPNGDLITSNGDAVNEDTNQPSELVEFTPRGKFVGQFSIDPGTGGAFGIALASEDGELRFAAVNDNTNAVDVWTFATEAMPFRHHGHG
jgi:uncharacterized protein (TIGR03118 family)